MFQNGRMMEKFFFLPPHPPPNSMQSSAQDSGNRHHPERRCLIRVMKGTLGGSGGGVGLGHGVGIWSGALDLGHSCRWLEIVHWKTNGAAEAAASGAGIRHGFVCEWTVAATRWMINLAKCLDNLISLCELLTVFWAVLPGVWAWEFIFSQFKRLFF